MDMAVVAVCPPAAWAGWICNASALLIRRRRKTEKSPGGNCRAFLLSTSATHLPSASPPAYGSAWDKKRQTQPVLSDTAFSKYSPAM